MDLCLGVGLVFLIVAAGVWLHRKIEASADWEDWESEDLGGVEEGGDTGRDSGSDAREGGA